MDSFSEEQTGSQRRLACAAMLTLGNAISGFFALLALARLIEVDGMSPLGLAASFIFASWLFDMLDGMAARAWKATSPFGAALDSLCDAVSFGVAPALLIAEVGSHDDQIGFAVSLVAAVAVLSGTLLRLARYTSHAVAAAPSSPGRRPLRYFEGLPSPAGAMTVVAAALLSAGADLSPDSTMWVVSATGIVVAIAMVSRLPYVDVPQAYLAHYLPSWSPAAPVALAIVTDISTALVAFMALYLTSGPAVRHWARSPST